MLAPPRRERDLGSLDDVLDYAEEFADALTPWEREFAESLRYQRKTLSPKQVAVVEQIIAKCRRADAMAAA